MTCATCPAVLSAAERHAYGASCENCRAAQWETRAPVADRGRRLRGQRVGGRELRPRVVPGRERR